MSKFFKKINFIFNSTHVSFYLLINFHDEVIKSLIETCTVYTFRLSHNGAEFYYSSQNFARNSDSFADKNEDG